MHAFEHNSLKSSKLNVSPRFLPITRWLPCVQLLDEPLPPAPVEVGLMPHWLFINGVQPAIPENAPIDKPITKRSRAQAAAAAKQQAAGGAKKQAPGAAPQATGGHQQRATQMVVC